MMLAEHHSDLYEATHPDSISHIVALTLAGMCTLGGVDAIPDDDDPEDDPENHTEGDDNAPQEG